MSLSLKKAGGKEPGRRRLSNLLALDFGTSGVKAVRLRRNKGTFALAAADLLPPCRPDSGTRPDLPKPLAAYYTALSATFEQASLRVFAQTLGEDDEIEKPIRDALSAPADNRIGGMILTRGKNKRESALLGISVPEATVQGWLALFASGAPAPHSLEISGLAAFSAFLYTCGAQTENQTICLLETGACCTYAAFLFRNQLQLINRFDAGGNALLRQVQSALGVDADMAETILAGGSVDVSAPVRHVLNPLARQLSIYREFIERQNKTTLSAVYLSGGQAMSPYWQSAVQEVLGVAPHVWNPFEKLELLPDAFPERLKGQEPRFAAAVGAALAGMENA
jgi:hypothetical protein